LDDWKAGWLATIPAFNRRAGVALWVRLLVRCGLRLAIASGFLLVVLPATSVGTLGLDSLARAIALAMIAGLAGRWFAPTPKGNGFSVLRVTRLTVRRAGTVPVWQSTVALTAWRTPKAAWWCMVILLNIPNGMPLAGTLLACLSAFIFGGAAAASSLSWDVLPRAFDLIRTSRRGDVLRQGLLVPGSAVLIGSLMLAGVCMTIGIPVLAVVVSLVSVSAWAAIRSVRTLWSSP
jgi:hypothetical protein